MKFDGAVIYVDDVLATLDFYRQAFGFETRFYDAEYQFGELDTGDSVLAFASHTLGELLMPDKYEQGADSVPAPIEIAFVTSDVPAAFAQAVGAGATPMAEPKLMPWGATIAYVRSIEGTLIGFSTPTRAEVSS